MSVSLKCNAKKCLLGRNCTFSKFLWRTAITNISKSESVQPYSVLTSSESLCKPRISFSFNKIMKNRQLNNALLNLSNVSQNTFSGALNNPMINSVYNNPRVQTPCHFNFSTSTINPEVYDKKYKNIQNTGNLTTNGNVRDIAEESQAQEKKEEELFHFHPLSSSSTRTEIKGSFEVMLDYLEEEEEAVLMKEVEPHLQRLPYEFDHWDDAIHGFRETERSRWGKKSSAILSRMRQHAFPEAKNQLPQTHVLDLAKNGVIKPHVDSTRFCGNIICGLSLLSDAVMRLVHVDEKDQVVDILLKRRSLYIMKNESRYKYTHEILSEKESYFGTLPVLKERRVSIICRNEPNKSDIV